MLSGCWLKLEVFRLKYIRTLQNPKQDALMPKKGVLISKVFTNQANLHVQISLASYLSKLIRISAPNHPFDDKLIKKAFQVTASSFQDLPYHAT